MKIVFWSEKKEAGTTLNMIVMAFMASIEYSLRTLLISADYNNPDLELSFHGGREIAVAELDNFHKKVDYGLDQLIEAGNQVTLEYLQKHMLEVIKDKIYCLPAGRKKYNFHYPESLAPLMKQIVLTAEAIYDNIFIDCGSKYDLFTRKMMRDADIVVVCMEQNSESFSQFFRKHYDIGGRLFYLISNYFADDVYNKASLERIFRMGKENIGAVPYNILLAKAFLSGQTEQYFFKYFNNEDDDRHTSFFQEIKETACLIFNDNIHYNH